VILKFAESFYDIFHSQKGFRDPFLDHFNFEIYGGTPILGINSPVIIGHGISKGLAIKNMIDVAVKQISSNLTALFKSHFAEKASQKNNATAGA
ncbi:MAG: hypothetical protein EBX41_08790, partial [Chitinophagia bacterium]|nr:hypothetical protein [Chitinophagia bacterium]